MENKKNNGLVVAFIIVLVVAVLGIGGTLYFYNKSLKESKGISNIDSNKNTNINEKNNNDTKTNNETYEYYKFITSNHDRNTYIYHPSNLNTYLQFAYVKNDFSIDNISEDTIAGILYHFMYKCGKLDWGENNANLEKGIHYIIEKEKADYLIKKYFGLDTFKLPSDIKQYKENNTIYYATMSAVFPMDAFEDLYMTGYKLNDDGTIIVNMNYYLLETTSDKILKMEIKLNDKLNIQSIKYIK